MIDTALLIRVVPQANGKDDLTSNDNKACGESVRSGVPQILQRLTAFFPLAWGTTGPCTFMINSGVSILSFATGGPACSRAHRVKAR